jgi:predicted metalloprotease
LPTASIRTTSALLVAVLTLTACAQRAPENPVASGPGFDDRASAELDDPVEPGTDHDDDGAPTAEEVLDAAVVEIEAWWERTYEDVYGTPYRPISGGFWAYGPDTELPPCGIPRLTYAEIADNAFYCPGADLIAWDAATLVPYLYEQFGGFTLAIVMAHELGHAVQERAGVRGPTIMTELQADCFAGAWTADVDAGGSPSFRVTLSELDQAVAGFLELRDGIGIDAGDPAAHGTGFDRIGAFAEGFQEGAQRCAEYPELFRSGEFVVVQVPFTDPEDFERGGNLPLADILELAVLDLEDFWTVLFDELGRRWSPVAGVELVDPATDEVECAGRRFAGPVLEGASFYCIDRNTIFLDGEGLIPPLYEIGDFAVATELARQYAYAAQVRLGDTADDLSANLRADCYAGLYASSGFLVNRPGQILVLSPGDLDEAVIAFLRSSDSGADVEAGSATVGTAFQRFDAFRLGFLEGTDACATL